MEWQHWAMSALFLASAFLPVVGLARVYRTTVKRAREYENIPKAAGVSGASLDQVQAQIDGQHEQITTGSTYALRDFVFIGGGLLLGAVGSIWAVVDSVL